MQTSIHIPGRPTTPEPQKLVALTQSLQHPDIERVGLTTTTDGTWALSVVVKNGTDTPIKEVEEKSEGFPVIYQQDYGRMPVARPAYPGLGE